MRHLLKAFLFIYFFGSIDRSAALISGVMKRDLSEGCPCESWSFSEKHKDGFHEEKVSSESGQHRLVSITKRGSKRSQKKEYGTTLGTHWHKCVV